MRAESPPGFVPSAAAMSDDRLGSVAVSISVSELQWTPDIAPAVMDRIARDAIAYPEQFDRRPKPPAPPPPPPVRPTASRAVGRLAVMAIVVLVILALVVILAAASGPLTGTAIAVADHLHPSLTLVLESA